MPVSRSSGKGRGATVNVVIAPQGGAPSGIPGGLGAGLPPSPMGGMASMPPRAPMPVRPPMAAPPGAVPPGMNRGGRVMAGSGSGLGRLNKIGR